MITMQQKYTRNLTVRILLTIIILSPIFSSRSFAQRERERDTSYINARNRLVTALKAHPIDQAFAQSIDKFYGKSCDSMLKKKIMIDAYPIKLVLTRLFETTKQKFDNGSISLLRVPSVNAYFLETMKANKVSPVLPVYRMIGLTQSLILDAAFDGTLIGDSIHSIVGIREMLAAPYYISTRISRPEYKPFRDTLLYFLANEQPETLTKRLAAHDSLVTALVNNSNNMTVRAVARTQQDVYYDKTLPFALAIQDNRTTAADVQKLTTDPEAYYKAFVDEVIRLHTDKSFETKSYLKGPVIALNKTLANKFYISEVNELHESPDNVRFKILNNRSPRELYFLLVGGTGELYTSSFLYIYRKFIKDAEKTGLDNFFRDIDYYQFDQFITNISGYGLVGDLAQHMNEESLAHQLGNMIGRISSSQLTDNEVILQAMTLSDVLYSLRDHAVIRDQLIKQIDNLKSPKLAYDALLQRLYAGLKGILQDSNQYSSVGNYDVLAVDRLKKNNSIVQACFFYDDEDGTNSFANSTATYTANTWEKKDQGHYIVFVSKSGNNMRVYMNKPNTSVGCDTAQDEMLRDIRRDGYEPTSYIHRGHSYYLFQSLRKMTPSAQFVFLGSCGGYNEVLELFRMNPDVNIIATRNIGSSQINDPMLQQINSNFVNNKDIVWDDLWKSFDAKFQSKTARDLFSSYIAPNKYIGIKYIRKVFNY